MKVRYIYSACIEIKTDDITILTDPWFTDGAYDGSWHQFPKIKDPLEILSEPDYIYVSHIHPDHYDPTFLRKAFEKWGPKPILIPNFEKNYLVFKMKSDGLEPTSTNEIKVGNTNIHIIPNVTGSSSDIDSALLVNCGDKTVLNLNDCIWKDEHVSEVQAIVNKYTKELDLLALGYTGAGAFPQTYFDTNSDQEFLIEKANKKKLSFFERYKRYCKAFPSKKHLPFAGKYILAGKLSHLNQFRGVADPTEVLAFDEKAIVLSDAGKGEINLTNYESTSLRTEKYSNEEIDKRLEEIKNIPLDYEKDILLPFEKINFDRLLRASYQNALRRSEVTEDYWFSIVFDGNEEVRYLFNTNKDNPSFEKVEFKNSDLPTPRSDMYLDYRYLYGLLTTVYHWNNAAVGSMYYTRREPADNFNKPAQSFLNFFSVC